jgi:hypothetical protein
MKMEAGMLVVKGRVKLHWVYLDLAKKFALE